MKTAHALSSTRANVKDVVGGRKTKSIVGRNETGAEAVLVIVGHDDAVMFSDEVESVPSLEKEDDDMEEEEEEESEEEWDSEDEEEYDEEDAELDEGLAERLRILADAHALKTVAVAFLHPERSVTVTAVHGRNYFERPSAPERKTDEDADEEVEILEDALELKKVAVAYLHPEVGVKGSAPENFGRNWFDRPSTLEMESWEDAEERASVLADAMALKRSAANYMHPEVGVTSADATAFGRNYFNRYSTPETEEDEFADERAEIMEEAAALKKLAVDYMHPEIGVTTTDTTLFGRNYFSRYSAVEIEDAEDEVPYVEIANARVWLADERALVLEEAAALKKSAVAYMHPEIGVSASEAALFGRNYFNRASAPETEEDEFADERAEIMEEAAALKKLAVDYMHPEVGVTTTDATLSGRNYFSRYSAVEIEDAEDEVPYVEIANARVWLADERARVFAEAVSLKKSAVAYMHPEVGVSASDAALFGRNYFNRYSAPEAEDKEDAEEHARVLADAMALKSSATAYMHPETGVTATCGACCGRNYFNRVSVPETEDIEVADERARVFAEAASLKKSAVDYMHPEVGVITTDVTTFGRNYFNRYSASEVELDELAEERTKILEEANSLKKLAAAVKGANLPSTKSTKLSSIDSYVGAAKKSASSVHLFGLCEEAF